MSKGCLPLWGRFLAKVILIVLGMLIVVGLTCWLGGWRTAKNYSDGLFLAGLVAMLLGGISFLGVMERFRNPKYTYLQTIAAKGKFEQRTRHLLAEVWDSYAFMFLMGTVGVVLMALSFFVVMIFP
jgi:hypothetical protein